MRSKVELDGGGKVHLRNDRDVGAVKDSWVFQRLVFAFGHRDKHQPKFFAQVVGGRANQIADILDEEQIQLVEVPFLQRPCTMAASR